MQHVCSWRTRALSLLLAAVMVLGFLPALPGGEAQAHWADDYLAQMVDWGLIRADQTSSPNEALTRADFMSIVNRAYGYHEMGPTPFEDVSEYDWFYDDVGIAYTAKYINGTSETTASPNGTLDRETAATILGRNMMLQDSPGEIMDFSDARQISNWSRGTIKASLEHYLVSGYDDGTFRPQRDVTWGEMAALMTRTIGTPVQEAGDYTLGGVFGNVTISSPGVTLRDTVISGDLYVTGGVGLGNIKLENVTVLGRIIASGTGESESGQASILLRNVSADELLVDNLQDNYVTIQADGITEIGKTTVRTSAYIEDNTPEGMGLKYIELSGDEGIALDLAGRIEEVVNKTPGSVVQAARGTVAKLTVDESAVNASLDVNRGAVVKELNLDVGTNVTGEGDIGKLNVNAPGSTVTILPDEIEIRPGITAIINGQEMDTVGAEESSREPLILSGYPMAADVAPTSISAVFATNKRGTVHWAVSAITDGSVTTDDLIKPPVYGSIAVQRGTTPIPQGNTEVSAPVTGLLAGGSYYLSAVLVDERGQQSPLKVIAFTTPDNTVPAFNQGYPHMSKVSRTDSVVVVSPNKDCKLYYALLPQGATPPTETELKTSAVAGALGYGVRDVKKNVEDAFRVNDVILDEQVTYVLYLWLVDANGANKSAITSLTFVTDDETPPEFIIDPSAETATVQATSVGLTFRLNENGTVYWVAVPAGNPYPLPQPGTEYTTAPLTSDYAKLQVSSGLGIGSSGRAGRVTAVANVDGTINVTGLQPETYYDFYYVAKDNAGPDRNYSVTVKKITIHTLDASAPIVKQSFSPASETGSPKVTSEIYIDFSEDVIFIGDGGNNRSLTELQRDIDTTSGETQIQAKNKLANALYNGLRLLKYPLGGTEPEESTYKYRVNETFGNDMLVDYTGAVVEDLRSKSGVVRVRFPASATHLISGGQYCFVVKDFQDSSQNELVPQTINFMDPASRKTALEVGHSVDYFIVDFASAKLERFTLQDGLPYKRSGGTITEETAAVDRAFSMKPEATSVVDPLYAYDILLWTNRPIEYDLYYRVKDSGGVVSTAEKIKSYADAGNLLKASNTDLDKNGWMYLGNSGTHYNAFTEDDPAKYQWAGKSVGFTFNNLDKNDFPKLINMKEGLTYEFAISLTKWGGETDPARWSGKTLMQVHVDAGISENLRTLGSSIQNLVDLRNEWQSALAAGINDGAMEIGSAPPEKYLELTITRDDTSIPQFADDYPVLKPTATKVDMDLALTTQGTIYWAIAEVTNGTPTVTTTVVDDAGRETNITPDQVPKTWPSIKNGSEMLAQPKLKLPAVSTVMSPTSATRFLDHGAMEYKDSAVPEAGQLLPRQDLKPNTTYYVYFVLKGPKSEPSEVQIYQFTTKKSPKPQINIRDNRDSSANIWTEENISSNYWYLVCTETNMLQISPLSEPFSKYVDGSGEYIPSGQELPNYYSNFTVLDALMTDYNYDLSYSGSTNNSSAYYPSTGTPAEGGDWVMGASVFDVYANPSVRDEVDRIVRSASTESGGSTNLQNVFADGNGRTTAGRETPQEVRSSAGDEIGGGNYIILIVAQNSQRFENDPPTNGGKDGFKASIMRQSDDSVPKLIGASLGDLTSGTADGKAPYSGTIQLDFNTELYYRDTLEWMNASNFKVSLPAGTAIISPSITSAPTSTFYLSFTGYNGMAMMTSETATWLVNSSNGRAKLNMYVSAETGSDQVGTTDDGKPVMKRYIQFTVYWGHPTDDTKKEDYAAFPLSKIYLEELGTGSAAKVTGISLDKTSVELKASKRQDSAVATLTPSGADTDSVKVNWTSDPAGVVNVNGIGVQHTVNISALKVGKTTVKAEVVSVTDLVPPATLEVTVRGKLDNLILAANTGETASVTNGAAGYTWSRPDNRDHKATLTFDTGLPADASFISVTSSAPNSVQVGTVTTNGTKATVPLTYSKESAGTVTITVKGLNGCWETGYEEKTITIELKGPTAKLSTPSLTANDTTGVSTITPAALTAEASDPNLYKCTWKTTDGKPHEAMLTFDTGVEVMGSDITVRSDKEGLVRVETARQNIQGKNVKVPLTFVSGSGTAEITITLASTGETKKIQITAQGSDTGGKLPVINPANP